MINRDTQDKFEQEKAESLGHTPKTLRELRHGNGGYWEPSVDEGPSPINDAWHYWKMMSSKKEAK